MPALGVLVARERPRLPVRRAPRPRTRSTLRRGRARSARASARDTRARGRGTPARPEGRDGPWRYAFPRARSISRPRMRAPSARSPLCSYSFVIQGLQAADLRGRLLGERPLDVHVLDVDRRRRRHLVRGQPVRVVETRPVALGQQLGRLAERRERAVVLEHPWVHVLAGEERGIVGVLGREQPLGRPARRAAVRVARLVDRARRAGCGRTPSSSSTSCRNIGEPNGSSSDVVELLGAVAHAEDVAELPEAPAGEPVAGREPNVLGLEPARGSRAPARGPRGSVA